jgi:hypothetical protein
MEGGVGSQNVRAVTTSMYQDDNISVERGGKVSVGIANFDSDISNAYPTMHLYEISGC